MKSDVEFRLKKYPGCFTVYSCVNGEVADNFVAESLHRSSDF